MSRKNNLSRRKNQNDFDRNRARPNHHAEAAAALRPAAGCARAALRRAWGRTAECEFVAHEALP